MSIKGGGGTPQIRNLFFGENFVRKRGGGTPLTDKIRKVVFEVFPKQVLKKVHLCQSFNGGKSLQAGR